MSRTIGSFALHPPLPGHPWYRLQYMTSWVPGLFVDDRAAYVAMGALEASYGVTVGLLRQLSEKHRTITVTTLVAALEQAAADLAACEEDWKEKEA